jgi:hypothetical protein
MNGNVRLELAERPHPYPSAPDSAGEVWGVIGFSCAGQPIFSTQWDLVEPIGWFAANREALAVEQLDDVAGAGSTRDPGTGTRVSLADALDRLGRRDDDDELVTRLFEYRQRHMLTFAMRGARVPQIVLGRNGEEGELSLAGSWAYRFDMQDFLDDAFASMRALLIDWRDRGVDVAGVDAILGRLAP